MISQNTPGVRIINQPTFETGGPSGEIFLDFVEPGDIPDGTRMRKGNSFIPVLYHHISAATVMLVKYSTAEKFSRWYFSIFFVPYGLPKLIVVDADGVFSGFFRQKNQKFYRSQFTQWHKKS